MKRRLLLGRAGAGKTHACLDRLVACLAESGRPLLLVPTESQAEHLRTLLLDRTPGLGLHAVVTFSRLAEDTTGKRLAGIASPARRDRIAHEVLTQHFPEAAAQPGFRAEFLKAVKEIKELGREVEATLDRARAHFGASSRGARLFEAYAAYARRLPGYDHEDLLREARDRLAGEPPALDLLLIDGFHDFTGLELEILDILAERAAESVLTLPLDPDDRGHPIFATAARTARHFAAWTVEPLRENRRCNGALAALERRLFRTPGEPVPARGIELLSLPTEEDEADRLARLVLRSGRPFRDFVLIRRSFSGLHGLYASVFARHGVPLRFFGSEPLGATPAARAIALWLQHLLGPVDAEGLLFLLRSPYFLLRPPAEEADALARRLREQGEPDDLADFPAIRAALARPEGSLPRLLSERFGVREALVARPDGDDGIARADRLLRLLQEEARAVADLPLDEAAARVLARLPLLNDRFRDRRHDCVYAVDVGEARQWEKPVALVAGLDALSFPRQVYQDLFLRDEERRALGDACDLHLPLRARREDEERYLFYVALTRARERLVLSWVAYDEEGTPRARSPYLDETLEHLAQLEVREVPLSELFPGPEDVTTRDEFWPLVADGLAHGRARARAIAASLYEAGAVDKEELAYPRRLELARRRPIRVFPEDPARTLSASSLNAYLRCPYLFLLRRVLRVEPPRERGLDPLVRGSIVHAALERFARDRGDAGAIFDEVFAAGTRGFRIGLAEEAHRRWMRTVTVRAAEELRDRPVEEVELPFSIPLGDVALEGFIDRIDRTPHGLLVRDYKTGAPDPKAALQWDDVQLDAYLLAVERPAGALFERLRKGDQAGFVVEELGPEFESRHVTALPAAELENRRATMRALVARVAREVRAGRLALAPRAPEDCSRDRCEGFDLCRVHRSRWLARAAREEEA